MRQYNLIKYASIKHQVTVLSLVQDGEVDHIESLKKMGVEVIAEPFRPPAQRTGWWNRIDSWGHLVLDPLPLYARTYPLSGLKRRLVQHLKEHAPDLIQCEHLFVAPLQSSAPGVPCVLTEHNVESSAWRRQEAYSKRHSRQLGSEIEAKKLERWERQWMSRARVCIAVSETDARELRRWSGSKPVVVAPNGVDTERYAPPSGADLHRAGMVFFGNLGYEPNGDAICYFCREIWPLVRANVPNASLSIVGPHASPELQALGQLPGVKIVGFVDDVRQHLWEAAICVVPLRGGGGTRLKILEALSAQCAVVSTSIGAEGLDLHPGAEIEIADSATEFANVTIKLLQDPEARAHLAERGRQAVAGRYDWSIIAPRLEHAYELAVNAGCRR